MESLIYLLKSTAILSLFLLVYEFFLKKETYYASNRIFLLGGIFTAAILPYLTIEEITVITETIESSSTQEVVATNLSGLESVTTIPQPLGFWESLDYVQLSLIVYLIITSFFLIKFLFSLWQLRSFLNKQENFYFKNGIKYIQTNEKTGAYSIFNNIVYNPEIHTATELDLILKHEEAHVQHNHSIDMLLGNLLVFLNWFNPLAWVYRKRISQNLEFLADQAVTKDLSSPKIYQLSLLNYIKVDSSRLPVNNFQKSFIKTRIKKLQQMRSKKYASLKIGLILPLLTVFYFAFQIESRAEIIYVEKELSTSEKPKAAKEENDLTSLKNKNIKLENTSIIEDSTQGDLRNDGASQTDLTVKRKQDSLIEETNLTKVKIDKNTTEKSLKKFQRILKKMHKIEFNYSNLKFDEEKNLTQIEMSLKGKDEEDYHYAILGNKPIPEIQIIISDDFTGFKTFTDKDKSINRNSAIIINGKPDENIDDELGKALRSAQKRNNKLKYDEVSTKELIKSVNVIKNEESGLILINDQVQLDSLEQGKNQQKRQQETLVKIIFTIDKTTTDEELEEIKSYFTKENFDFSYRVPRRNKNGEITKIKIKVEDEKGQKSSTAYQNNHGIDSFTIGFKDGEFFSE